MHRLFVALRPPADIRERLLSLMHGVDGARWQTDDQLHLTVRFIGEVETPVANDLAAALAQVKGRPLALRLDGVGQFDTRGRVQALWAGVTPHGDLAALHRKVDRACQHAGLTAERRAYLPHITLARMARDAPPATAFLAREGGLTTPAFEISHFGLYESRLGKSGAAYDLVARYPLAVA